jgi:methylenetetrahydrofolate reductase (NADPH)
MSSLAVCALLTRVGYAPVMQISCRDRNRIAIQGDILGGAAMGVCNMLCLTGDGVQAGDHPQAKPVFDLDCMTLLEIGRALRDEHRFESGRKITFAPRVFFGAAENPFALPYEWRPFRLAKKVAAGAQFIQTQYCYDVPRLGVLRGVDELGFSIARSSSSASGRCAPRRPRNGCARTCRASTFRMRSSRDGRRRRTGEGRPPLCIDLIRRSAQIKGVAGVHVMAYRQEESVAEVITESGVLNGRVPWHPTRPVS